MEAEMMLIVVSQFKYFFKVEKFLVRMCECFLLRGIDQVMVDEQKEQSEQQGQREQGEQKDKSVDRLEQLLDCEKKRSEDYLNRLRYLQADLENLKKRCDREAEQIRNSCNEHLVIRLLDIVDELELAVKNGEISTSPDSLLVGVEMTLKKLRKVLEQEGVTPIDSPEGKAFDPSCHHAITAIEREDVEESTVLEEIRKGYMMRGKVIRPSIVKVAVKPKNQSNPMEEKKKNE
jgi:molecular chaperone GrpE